MTLSAPTRPRLYQNGQANGTRQNDIARPCRYGRVGLVAGRASSVTRSVKRLVPTQRVGTSYIVL